MPPKKKRCSNAPFVESEELAIYRRVLFLKRGCIFLLFASAANYFVFISEKHMCTLRNYPDIHSKAYKAAYAKHFPTDDSLKALCRGGLVAGFIKSALTETARQRRLVARTEDLRGVIFATAPGKGLVGAAAYTISRMRVNRQTTDNLEFVVDMLCTKAAPQGVSGCGKKLLRKARHVATAAGAHLLSLDAVPEAVKFYHREGLLQCDNACSSSCKPVKNPVKALTTMSFCLKCDAPGRRLADGRCKWKTKQPCPAGTHSTINARNKTRECAPGRKLKVICGIAGDAEIKTGPRGGKYVMRRDKHGKPKKQYCSTITAKKKPRKDQVKGKVGRPKKT